MTYMLNAVASGEVAALLVAFRLVQAHHHALHLAVAPSAENAVLLPKEVCKALLLAE